MQTIFNGFIKNIKHPSQLKFNKTPVLKDKENELNKDEKTKAHLLALIDQIITYPRN